MYSICYCIKKVLIGDFILQRFIWCIWEYKDIFGHIWVMLYLKNYSLCLVLIKLLKHMNAETYPTPMEVTVIANLAKKYGIDLWLKTEWIKNVHSLYLYFDNKKIMNYIKNSLPVFIKLHLLQFIFQNKGPPMKDIGVSSSKSIWKPTSIQIWNR